jgi:hypothetical protein
LVDKSVLRKASGDVVRANSKNVLDLYTRMGLGKLLDSLEKQVLKDSGSAKKATDVKKQAMLAIAKLVKFSQDLALRITSLALLVITDVGVGSNQSKDKLLLIADTIQEMHDEITRIGNKWGY